MFCWFLQESKKNENGSRNEIGQIDWLVRIRKLILWIVLWFDKSCLYLLYHLQIHYIPPSPRDQYCIYILLLHTVYIISAACLYLLRLHRGFLYLPALLNYFIRVTGIYSHAIIKKYLCAFLNRVVWSGFIWLRIRIGDGLLWKR
jgi:hypothetical protein